MRINLIKQSLFPAALTLLCFVVLTMCHQRTGVVGSEEVARYGLSVEALPIPPLGAWVDSLQHHWPTVSRWISGLLLLFTGISLGRLTVRYNLYGSGTCLSISLYGMLMVGALGHSHYLLAVVVSTLTALAIKNLCMSHRNGFGFDRIFRGAMFATLVVLVEPSAAPLLLAVPMAVTHFRRTTRESIVAMGGLLLPIALLCYLNWGLGGTFTAPLQALYRAFMNGEWLLAIDTSSMTMRCFVGSILLLVLMATVLFRTNSYNINTKARHIMLFMSRLFWLLLTLFLLPSASEMALAVILIPATLLLPMLLVRIHQALAQIIYLTILVGSLALLFIA